MEHVGWGMGDGVEVWGLFYKAVAYDAVALKDGDRSLGVSVVVVFYEVDI